MEPDDAADCSGETESKGAFVIDPCRWVHTIGMRFPLDIAYLDEDGNVAEDGAHGAAPQSAGPCAAGAG